MKSGSGSRQKKADVDADGTATAPTADWCNIDEKGKMAHRPSHIGHIVVVVFAALATAAPYACLCSKFDNQFRPQKERKKITFFSHQGWRHAKTLIQARKQRPAVAAAETTTEAA